MDQEIVDEFVKIEKVLASLQKQHDLALDLFKLHGKKFKIIEEILEKQIE